MEVDNPLVCRGFHGFSRGHVPVPWLFHAYSDLFLDFPTVTNFCLFIHKEPAKSCWKIQVYCSFKELPHGRDRPIRMVR